MDFKYHSEGGGKGLVCLLKECKCKYPISTVAIFWVKYSVHLCLKSTIRKMKGSITCSVLTIIIRVLSPVLSNISYSVL